MKQYVRVPALGLALVLTACPGGGDSRDEGAGRSFLQAYVSYDFEAGAERLVLVDPDDFTDRRDLGLVSGLASLITGDRDGDTLRDAGIGFMYFVRDGHWRKVDLRGGRSHEPRQISNATLERACDSRLVQREIGRTTGSVLFYQAPGADGECWSPDDVARRIGVDDGPTKAPVAGIGDIQFTFRDSDGVLLGVLAGGAAELRVYPPDFSEPTVLAPAASVTALGAIRAGGLFTLGDQVHYIDANGTFSAALHTWQASHLPWPAPIDDGTYVYFDDAPDGVTRALYRLRLDGSAPSELLVPAGEYETLIGVTTNSLVVGRESGDGYSVVLLDRATGAYQSTLHDFPGGGVAFGSQTRRPPLLYSTWDYSTNTVVARRLDDDGTLASGPDHSVWGGEQWSEDWPLAAFSDGYIAIDPPNIGAFLVTNFTTEPTGPMPLALVDLATGRHAPLLDDITALGEVAWMLAIGSTGMGTAWQQVPDSEEYDSQSDVFSFDIDDHRFERHTNGTPEDEFPYSF